LLGYWVGLWGGCSFRTQNPITQNPAALTKNNGPFIDKFVKVMHPGS
jgi:hypothetical protein